MTGIAWEAIPVIHGYNIDLNLFSLLQDVWVLARPHSSLRA